MIQGMGSDAQPADELPTDMEDLLVYTEPTNVVLPQIESTPEPSEEILPEQSACTPEQCLFQEVCVTKPSHATCLIQDSNNARVCDEGYVEVGSSCLSPTQYAQRVSQKQATAQQQAKATSDAEAQAALLAQQQAAAEQKKQADLLAQQQAAAQAKAKADAEAKAALLAQQQADAQAAADAQAKAALLAQQQAAATQPTRRRTRAS